MIERESVTSPLDVTSSPRSSDLCAVAVLGARRSGRRVDPFVDVPGCMLHVAWTVVSCVWTSGVWSRANLRTRK